MAVFKDKVNPKVWDLFVKRAGDRVEELLAKAEDLAHDQGLSPERALAEALSAPKPRKPKKTEEESNEQENYN